MENKIEIKRDLAHVDYESGRYQTMKEHSENVANYVAETLFSFRIEDIG